jgi:hypothetical protein
MLISLQLPISSVASVEFYASYDGLNNQ